MHVELQRKDSIFDEFVLCFVFLNHNTQLYETGKMEAAPDAVRSVH